MAKYSIFSLVKNALSHHQNWDRAWRDNRPKDGYDVIIIGGGGHGLATAYYLAKEHGITGPTTCGTKAPACTRSRSSFTKA